MGHVHAEHVELEVSENGCMEEAVALSAMKVRGGSSSVSRIGSVTACTLESQHFSSGLPLRCCRSEHVLRTMASVLWP